MKISNIKSNFKSAQTFNIWKKLDNNNISQELISKCFNKQYKAPIGPLIKGSSITQFMTSKNLLGLGNANRAYSIDSYPNFVLRVPKSFVPQNDTIFFYKPISPELQEYNFGLPIVNLGHGVEILNKVEGESNSIPNWINQMKKSVYYSEPVGKSDAKTFLNNLIKISNFPIEAYVDLAKKFKSLNDTPYTPDFLNPNNILVDFKNKKFNVIDLWKNGKYDVDGIAGCEQMQLMLCDGILHEDIKKALQPEDTKKFQDAIINIIDHCKKASNIVQLPDAEYEIITACKFLDKIIKSKYNIDTDFLERYISFKNKYNL